MIIIVAISSTNKSDKIDTFNINNIELIERPLSFKANSINFATSEYYNVIKIFENADLQAMRFEMYQNDSLNTINIGVIGKYKFEYRYAIKFHFIKICDTITNNQCYILKSNKFIDELILH